MKIEMKKKVLSFLLVCTMAFGLLAGMGNPTYITEVKANETRNVGEALYSYTEFTETQVVSEAYNTAYNNVAIPAREEAYPVLQLNAMSNSHQYNPNGNDGPATWAFDGNDTHWWHSRWGGTIGKGEEDCNITDGTKKKPWIGSGFGKSINLGRIAYLGRGDGWIVKYNLYVANMTTATDIPSVDDWTPVIENGVWRKVANQYNEVTFTPVQATHFKLEVLQVEGGDTKYTSAKDIKAYSATEYTVGDELTETVTVEARYSSNRLSWDAVEGATEYRILRADSETGTFREVDTVTTNAYVDTTAGVGTQYSYKVAAIIGTTARMTAVATATCPTGIEAVQTNAQLHYDLEKNEGGRIFDGTGSRIVEKGAEDVDKIKNLAVGTVLISFKSKDVDSRSCLFAVKNSTATVATGNTDSNPSGVISFSHYFNNAGQLRYDFGDKLKSPESGVVNNKWMTFGLRSGSGGTNNVTGVLNGNQTSNYRDNQNFFTKGTNLNELTIGGAKNNGNVVIPYKGEIAYLTITDEVLPTEELKAYTAALSNRLEIETSPNLARKATVTANGIEATSLGAEKINDGIYTQASNSRWSSTDKNVDSTAPVGDIVYTANPKDKVIAFDFAKYGPQTIKQIVLRWERDNARAYRIEVKNGGEWTTVKEAIYTDDARPTHRQDIVLNDAIQAEQVRLVITNYSNIGRREGATQDGDWGCISLYEIEMYSTEMPDKEGLKAKIDAVNAAITSTLYVDGALRAAVSAAQAVYDNADATCEDVNAQKAALDALEYTYKHDFYELPLTAEQVITSNRGEGQAANLVDGLINNDSYWMSTGTVVDTSETLGDKFMGIAFAEPTLINGMEVFPRNQAPEANGIILGYKIYASQDGENFAEEPCATGTWTVDRGWKRAEFAPVWAKAVKVVATSSENPWPADGNFIAASEIKVTSPVRTDLSHYKASENRTEWTAPEYEGKVFAGWYEDSAFATPKMGREGHAYPKFVNEGVLSAKIQLPAGDAAKDRMRFITTVDSLRYESAGFAITINGKTLNKGSNKVWNTIYATIGETTETKVPTQFHEDSRYFFTYTITGIPSNAGAAPITVTPYVVTLDGTTSYGVSRTVTINELATTTPEN